MSGFFTTLLKNIKETREIYTNHFQSRKSFFLHLHPTQITEQALYPPSTLGLGIVILILFLVLSSSGFLLMIYYLPTANNAHASIQDIQYAVSFGSFSRALHYWSAHAMVIFMLLHLIRVLFCAGYRDREFNWFLGLMMCLITLALGYTGALLPWDQRAFWATTIVSRLLDNLPFLGPAIKNLMLGGTEVTQSALLRFYVLHVTMLPAALTVLIALHFWRIRKDGGLAVSSGVKPTIPAHPHLLMRELALALVILAVLCFVSTYLDAPLDQRADPHLPSNPEKAPWYFLWLQEMVSYSSMIGGLCFPVCLLLSLFILPVLDRERLDTGKWLGAKKDKLAVLISQIVAVATLLVLYWIHLSQAGSSGSVGYSLLNPASGMLFTSGLTFFVAGWVSGSVRTAMLACMTVLLTAVIGCTLAGLCRGPDWVLYWPWEDWSIGS